MRRSERVAALVVALTLPLACSADDRPPLERARDLVDDDGAFGTAIESGDSFAHIGELLLDAADACEDPCPALRQASAYTQLLAVEVLGCTQPGIHDARVAVRDHLDAVISVPSGSAPLPALPTC